jgi:hypothetical protein
MIDNVELIGTPSQRRAWKQRILGVMYDPVVANFARERGIRPRDIMGEPILDPTFDDYRSAVLLGAELDHLIAYCENHAVPIRDVTEEIGRSRSRVDRDARDRRRQSSLG